MISKGDGKMFKNYLIKLTICFFTFLNVQLADAQQSLFQVTFETEGVSDFIWSPDGNQFAYIALENDTSKLYRIDADGNNKTLLTSTVAWGNLDWKDLTITFNSSNGSSNYDGLVKRIAPDGSNETTIIGPYWYGAVLIRKDADWILYRDAPGGWWQARRCDLNGNDDLILETANLVQQIGWLGKNYILYSRGANYNTPCGIHKVDFNGNGHVQLTSENLPNNATFIASPDTSKILYCDGSTDSWDIWIMDDDGNNKTQLTFDPANDYLSNTRDNIWSQDGQSFYFVSSRTGNGDIYKLNIDGSGLTQVTFHDSLENLPIPSPDGKKLAFVSKRDGDNNIWVLSPPQIYSHSPGQNQLNVPVDAVISVTFDMDMDEATINDTTFIVNSKFSGIHQGTITYDSFSKTAGFTPLSEFAVGDVVTVALTNEIQSAQGIPLNSSYVLSFTIRVQDGPAVFDSLSNYPTGSSNLSVFAADLDGDGDLDLAMATVNPTETATVILNNGDGTYGSPSSYAVGERPRSIVAADFDGDGNLDLAISYLGPPLVQASGVSILMNDGNGTFSNRVDYGVDHYPGSVFAADLDGDGDLDLATANFDSDNLSVLLNNGDGSFAAVANYPVNVGPESIFAADLDNDGDLDLATANVSSHNISVLLNYGNGTFVPYMSYSTDYSPYSIFAADLDNDTDLDLMTSNLSSNSVSILLNDGHANFSNSSNQQVGNSPNSIFAADLEGDGDLDLITANSNSDNVSILLNNGDASFASPVSYPTGSYPMSIFAADLDGDGDLDLAAANNSSSDVSILLNLDNPNILSISPSQNELNVMVNACISVTFDMDMDTKTINDTTFLVNGCLTGLHEGNIIYDSTARTVTFVAVNDFAVGEVVTIILTKEIHSSEGCSLDSIFCWQFTTAVHKGSGHFELDSSYSVGANPYSPVAADFDRDGDLDLVTANRSSNNISVLLNAGDANFLLSNNYEIGSQPETVFAADLDNDGDIDLAAANRITPGSVRILLNYGDGTFDVQPSFPSNGNEPGSICAADLDGDSDLDLIIGNDGTVSIFFNNGDATFIFEANYSIAGGASVNAADLDNDGDLDLTGGLWANNAIFVLMNNGDGSFGSLSTYPVGVGPAFVKAADLNGDGYLDLCSTNHYDQTASILMNNGDGTFATHITYNVGVAPYIAFPADLDSDGDLDLTVQNREDDNVSVLLNHGDGTFADQQLFSTGDGPINVLAADLDIDGDLDLVTANINSNDVSILLNLNIPQITSIFPTLNHLNVMRDASISVTFDMDMDALTFQDATFIVYTRSAGILQGTISYDSKTRTATFDPDHDFDAGEVVTAVLTTGILSAQGLALAKSHAWSFTVEADQAPATFSSDSTYQVEASPVSVFGADLNSDGHIDLATANEDSNSVSVLLNNGDGSLGLQMRIPTGRATKSVYATDLDNDGDLDLATANAASGNISLLFNDGTGNFAADSVDVSGMQPVSIFATDFDGDGYADLATANSSSNNVSVLLNKGDGTFSTDSLYPVDVAPFSITAADLDNDGDFDITTVNVSAKTVSVLLNKGDGTFVPDSVYVVGFSWSIVAADLNGDNYVDLATANFDSNNVAILLNLGNGTFGNQAVYPVGNIPMSIFAADLDGDGDIDLATTNIGSTSISLLLNNGDANFTSQTQFTVLDPYGLFSVDFDADGDLDIAVTNWSPHTVTLLMNRELVGLKTPGDQIPKQFALHQNYPNPFNPVTFINYDLPKRERVDLIIYNTLGQKVKTLLSKNQESGYYTAVWDATNDNGNKVSSGLYFYRLQAGKFIDTKKVILLK